MNEPQIEAFIKDFRELLNLHQVPGGYAGAIYIIEAVLFWTTHTTNEGEVGNALSLIRRIADETYRRRQL